MFTDYEVSAEVVDPGRLELTDRDAFSKAMRYFKRGIRRFALVDLRIETPDPDPALRGKSRHAKRSAA